MPLLKNVRVIKSPVRKMTSRKEFCHQNRFTENENGWTVVQEGKAQVLFPSQKDVFYNPVQEFNRDLSIAVIKLHAKHHRSQQQQQKQETNQAEEINLKPGLKDEKGITILEALSASGLRSIRFAREIPGLKSILANDWSKQAVESIERNVKHNGVEDIVQASNGDAGMVMYGHRRTDDRFHVIDLDPYGSPTPFLDAAVQSVADGGLLCVTATDMAVLCGNTPETCYTKYGAISLKTKSCHEFALRILLQCLESHANRYGRYIQPLLSLSIDFYCRVFVRVHSGQATCKLSTSKLGYVFQCTGCESLSFQRLGQVRPHENGKNIKFSLVTGPPVGQHCKHCANSFHMGGPIWLDPIHSPEFVTELLDSIAEEEEENDAGQSYATMDRMKGMLTMALEELNDVPLYYDLTRLCNIVKQNQGKLTLYTSAILNAGYEFSLSHANKHGLKTTAPIDFLWDMLRSYARLQPAKEDPLRNLAPESPGYRILSQPAQRTDISFEPHPAANPESRQAQLKRFQLNPEPNWGPKMRAKTSTVAAPAQTKQQRNQDRKQRQDKPLPPAADDDRDAKEGRLAKKQKCDPLAE